MNETTINKIINTVIIHEYKCYKKSKGRLNWGSRQHFALGNQGSPV